MTHSNSPSNVNVLARQVKEKLIGKKYLLVLDDLWNEDPEDWEKLMAVLVYCVEGSKLLVTTRSQKVSSIVGGKVHHLKRLSDDFCWSIMQKKISFQFGAVLSQNLSNIGRDIAKKCNGLPLAANFLGSLLNLKRDESYWVSINNDRNLWVQPQNKRVISILKLSYDNLTLPLKLCFSYCCLFPKDWEIKRELLIRMWMAEGFLPSNDVNNTRSFEDIGNDYFEFLLWNSFFQDVKQDELGVILTCKMHDLVHDLAISIADSSEFGIGEKVDVTKVRRLQLICDSESLTTTAKVLSKAKKLRTVFVLHPRYCSQVGNFSSAKHLRILFPLGHWGRRSSFSLYKFKHLRFLDLSNCEIDLAHDVSLNHSHNLQTLILRRCKNVSGFLSVIGHLKNLRHLDVSESDIKVLHDDCISNLTNLQTLNIHWCSEFEALPENIGVLKHLSFLNFSYSSSITKIPDSITCISNLTMLEFTWCSNIVSLPKEIGALTRLRCLDLYYTKIKVLPESCISNLCNLEIVNFGNKCELPKEIKNWPKLRQFRHSRYGDPMPRGVEKLTCLEILKSYMVREQHPDIQVCGSGPSGIGELAPLNSLQVLRIRSLENVRGGFEDAERAKLKDKQKLRELYLIWISNEGDAEDGENDDMVLKGLRPHPNLKTLEIHGFSGLNFPKWMGSTSICMLPNLVRLWLSGCNSCEMLPELGLLPCLRDLMIREMKSVKCLVGESTSSSLFPSLVLLDIFFMENLEEWFAPPSSDFYVDSFLLLENLHLRGCTKLRSAPNSFPSLKELKLSGTMNSIFSASSGCLTSLTSIVIEEYPELIYFPLGALLQNNNPNLCSLSIRYCYEFQGFRDDDDDDLNNNNNCNNTLHKLELDYCPVLTTLPDLRLWTSLRELTIFRCDEVKESIPYDLKTSLSFLHSLKVDFIQREDPQLQNPDSDIFRLINLMEK